MTFLWSDAWILHAVALASARGPADLAAVLAAADAVSHALPTSDELHGAFVRLTAAGFVEETSAGFSLGSQVSAEARSRIVASAVSEGGRQTAKLLSAEPWSPATNVRDPRNRVRHPSLTEERLRAAEAEHRRR